MSLSKFIVKRSPAAGLILLATLGMAGCSQEKSEVKDVIRPVKVVEIGKVQDTRQLDYSGSVRSRTEMNLGFRIAGKITERLVNVGQHVNSGDVLARVDPSDYELSVKSAEASLDAAERQVETVDLARKRAEAAFPLSLAEIAADRDHLRAELAVRMRSVEQEAERGFAAKAGAMQDIGRRDIVDIGMEQRFHTPRDRRNYRS